MDLGPHAVFIWASYGAFVLILMLLIGWIWIDGRRQARALADADRRGLKRRSAGTVKDAP
ncbi:heme exporter protein CcmD [Hyphomicrobium sp.]|uniref:heme exporter protein CcmD n=1 Tax=Hyphomicrobium sp. TaxID=82 RepID=UPI002C568373|nr:heme exporter protein CcmD [Hyphomicrobium sp.]HRN87853.1 heme exporter protein CcmD [Hyphomicrobium sp.]HRQ26616.1 heme exporter protein CcmD [Hyphomicrobium sp.]